ncbi:MAG: CHAP domain-containing protein [Ruminococcus sp.]|nr:CHAP domain-containing protein [Ruminococcus sp.]
MSMDSMLGKRLGNFNSSGYNDGIRGQCVWYVRGRGKEKVGVDTGIRGDAKAWFAQAKHKGREPKGDSIACFNSGKFGHVIYVESIESGFVYYTEANAKGTNKNGYISVDDGTLKKQAISAFKSRKGYQGCIYLLEYKKKSPGSNTARTTADLNYRDKPGGKIIGTLSKGTIVEYIPGYESECGGYIWIKIRYRSKEYYVSKKFLEL